MEPTGTAGRGITAGTGAGEHPVDNRSGQRIALSEVLVGRARDLLSAIG